jgi:hypothetical protein
MVPACRCRYWSLLAATSGSEVLGPRRAFAWSHRRAWSPARRTPPLLAACLRCLVDACSSPPAREQMRRSLPHEPGKADARAARVRT